MSVGRLIHVMAMITVLEMTVTVAFVAEIDPLTAVPGSCNAVAVVQMRNLVNSPLGRRQKWFDETRRAYAEGLMSGPPWVKEIIQATTVGSANGSEPISYSIYGMNQPSIIGDIAKHEQAPREKLAGHGAVASPRNIFFIQLAPGLVAAVQPANRQAASQWARSFDEKKLPAISSDLVDALKRQDSAQVSIAVDLKGKLNARYILNWLVGTPKLRATDDIEGLARELSSLRIVRLSVQFSQTIVAQLQLDFDSPITKHAKGLEKAVLQWIDDAGARPQVLAAAKTSFSEKSLTFEVPLDEVGLRRLLSLIQSPHISSKELAGAESREPNAVASTAYYNKVNDLLNSLLYKNRNASEYEKTALWHEQFARKIAGLPATAVDPELIRWGRDVSKELIALASSLRGEVVKVGDLERSIRVDETTQNAWFGYSPASGPLYFPAWVTSNDNLDAVRGQQAVQLEKSASERDAIWNVLYQGTAQIARKMEAKYQIKLKLPK